jgi:hypothetical protein
MQACFATAAIAAAGRGDGKSEIRNPKTEGNPNTEIRNPDRPALE